MAGDVKLIVEKCRDDEWTRLDDRGLIRVDQPVRIIVRNTGESTLWVAAVLRVRRRRRIMRIISDPDGPLALAPAGRIMFTLPPPATWTDAVGIGVIAASDRGELFGDVQNGRALKYQDLGWPSRICSRLTLHRLAVKRSRALEGALAAERVVTVFGARPSSGLAEDISSGQAGWIIFGSFSYAFALRGWADLTLDGEGTLPGWGIAGAVVGAGLLAAYVKYTGFWRLWRLWRPSEDRQAPAPILTGLLLIPMLIWFFTLLNCLLFAYELTETDSTIAHNNLVDASERWFAWQLVSAVPLLELPATFDWEPAVKFDGLASGFTVLAFRVLVIAPVIALAAAALSRRDRGL